MRRFEYKWMFIFFMVGMIVLHGAMLWKVHERILQGYGDFASFYTAGKIVQSGRSTQLYDRHLQWQVQQEFASSVKTRLGPLPYIRPPFEALLFFPLAYLNYPAAYVTWAGLNLLGLVAVSFLLPSDLRVSQVSPLVLGILFLGFFPVAFDFLGGQDAIVLLLVMVLALRSLLTEADFRSGMILGLGLFKFHFLFPIFFVFVFRRNFRIVLGFLSTACLLLLISVALVGPAGVIGYPKYLWDLSQSYGVGVIKTQGMPNIRGLFVPLLGTGSAPNWVPWLLLAIVIAGIAVTAYIWRVDSRDSRLVTANFSFSIVVILVTSYYANSYDLTLLLLPILLLLGNLEEPGEIKGWPRVLSLTCLALLLFSPVWWILVLRYDQFYWSGIVLLFLAIALGKVVRTWQSSQLMVQPSTSAVVS